MVERRKNQKSQQQGLSIDDINAQYGKLPPQATEVEEVVLGALMLERDAMQMVTGILDTQSFYKETHQKIFEVIKDLFRKEKSVDLMMVSQELKNREQLEEVGGPGYITQLTRRVASAAHIEFHARIIAQKFIQREMIRISSELQNKSYDDTIDIDDLIEFARSEFAQLDNFLVCANPGKTTKVVAKEAITDLEADVEANKAGEAPGISTGLKDLNRSTGG